MKCRWLICDFFVCTTGTNPFRYRAMTSSVPVQAYCIGTRTTSVPCRQSVILIASYVRCILIDYCKAFDSINHPILFQKLLQLNIPPNVLLWIINFLSNRTQAVSSSGQISGWLPITQSIIQGSGIGPYLYMILCFWLANFVSTQCHRQICWWHYPTCWST